MTIRRRELLGVAGGLLLGGLATWAAQRYLLPPDEEAALHDAAPICPVTSGQNLTPDQALERLRAGNQRFVEGRSQYRLGFKIPDHILARDYRPFAVIVSCSDARVACEILLDERISDLFVVRQAAHRVGAESRTSIEFAVNYFQVPLVLVLGHSGCSTLAAALGAALPDAEPPAYLEHLSAELNSVVKGVQNKPGEPLENAVVANVQSTVLELRSSAQLQPLLRENRLRVLGAHYTLPPGEIKFLEEV